MTFWFWKETSSTSPVMPDLILDSLVPVLGSMI